jgi:hypothetical protein
MPNYSVVIAVHDCHSQNLGVHLFAVGGETVKEAAVKAIYSSGFFKEFLSEWANKCVVRNVVFSEDDVIDQMKDYAMLGVFEQPSFPSQQSTDLL